LHVFMDRGHPIQHISNAKVPLLKKKFQITKTIPFTKQMIPGNHPNSDRISYYSANKVAGILFKLRHVAITSSFQPADSFHPRKWFAIASCDTPSASVALQCGSSHSCYSNTHISSSHNNTNQD